MVLINRKVDGKPIRPIQTNLDRYNWATSLAENWHHKPKDRKLTRKNFFFKYFFTPIRIGQQVQQIRQYKPG